MIGKTISHYRILEKLGEGGMGVVYKAEDLRLTRTVALKFLPHGLDAHEPERARFLQEARSAAILNHPNICTIHDIQEFGGQQFIVMEYVEGRTLREIIPVHRLQDAITYAIQIAEALQEAHSKGIVHRDIKGENIMVNTKNQVKVMDFGLAKLKGSLKLTKTSSTIGTLAYMAPEQIQGGEIDARSDIFSFGVVVYEMLTGHLPFKGEHEAAVMYSIVNEDPESLQVYLPNPPSELIHTVSRALEKDPEERYQTIREMLIDLRRLKKDSSRVLRRQIPAEVAPAVVPSEIPVTATPTVAVARKGIQRKWIWLGGAIVAALSIGLALLLLPGTASVKLNPSRSFRGLVVPFKAVAYGSLSKHGDWLVFPAQDDSSRWDVYWTSIAGGEPSRITHEKSFRIVNTEISPEADRVVYDRITDPDLLLSQIQIVPLQGGFGRCIADTGIGGRWTPDGKRIGFMRAGRRGSNTRAPSASGGLEIWSVNPDGTDPRLELRDTLSLRATPYSFCWSPDGRSVAWVRNAAEECGEVMVRELATGKERQLTYDKKSVDEVIWASNDNILFVSNKSGSSDLWAIPAAGGEEVQVTQGTSPVFSARISADTRRLVCFQLERTSHLWMTDIDGRNKRQLTYDDVNYYSAALSPDAQNIAVVIASVDMFNPERHLYVMGRDGKSRRALTSGQQIADYCRWSPDGKWLAYTSRSVGEHPDSEKVYIVDPANPGTPRLLGPGSFPEWVDSEHLVAVRRQRSWRYSVMGGTPVQVYKDSTGALPLYHIQHMLYYDARKGREGYWIVAVDSTGRDVAEPRRLQSLGLTGFAMPSGSRFLVYRKIGRNEIWRLWLPDGREERLGSALPGMTYMVDMSRDGRNILWLEFIGHSKLALIENLFE